MQTYAAKRELRTEIALRKKAYSRSTLFDLSDKILENLEQTEVFQKASCLAMYHAIPGEVQTAAFLDKWFLKKKILLPVIEGNDLRLRPYTGNDSLKAGKFGILEPTVKNTGNEEYLIDLIIVPGVAFDRQRNRMGRGKGYYDRLLTTIQAPKAGICFDFQLFPAIPVEAFDKKMDLVITESEMI